MAVAEAVRPEQLDLPTPPSRPARPRPWTPSAALIRPTPGCPQHSGAAELRRFYRHPTSGALVAMESHSRCFPKGLASSSGCAICCVARPIVMPRSGTVIMPNPVTRVGRPAPSTGWGECESCNYTKGAPGWRVSTAEENGVPTAEFTTPTGARYYSTAPPAPGRHRKSGSAKSKPASASRSQHSTRPSPTRCWCASRSRRPAAQWTPARCADREDRPAGSRRTRSAGWPWRRPARLAC
jgi:hypothetical protein